MKPKNKIKLHKSVIEVISSATELVNAMMELHKLKRKSIPEYKKGEKDRLMIVDPKKCEHVFNTIRAVYISGKLIRHEKKCSLCRVEVWNSSDDLFKNLRNRQTEIGKEIEKLRNEARTIKNQLKDLN